MRLGESVHFELRTILKKALRILPDPLKEAVEFALFVIHYFYRAVLEPLSSIPRASLYYLHAPYQFPAVWLLSKWYRVPFIYDAHDFYIGIKKNLERTSFERRWIDPFYRKVEEICIRHAAAVVTVSEGIANLIKGAFGVQPVVIRSFQDLRLEKPPAKSLRTVLGLSQSDFLLVSIGQAKKGMAVRECLDAMGMLPSHVHLAFVGGNHEQNAGIISDYGLEGRVHIVQPVKPFEVISFVKSADAALILYYARSVNYEFCLPNGFFQSVSAEIPVLYPELTEIKRLGQAYEIGIPIDPCVPESISTAVKKLIDNPALRLQYRKNVSRAKEDLCWEKEEVFLRDLILKASKHGFTTMS
jgi:glycosyltransferase involved in cell wall biosynthesis